MESYIVRVYRRDEKDPENIVGMVEVVKTGAVKKFADRSELCDVICQRSKEKRRRSKERASDGGSAQ